jgi:hypothetical protein
MREYWESGSASKTPDWKSVLLKNRGGVQGSCESITAHSVELRSMSLASLLQ